ncbi:MAG: NAD(P)/FAD-dependent oxidoreductase [Marinobacter sp.]|nr:NAD(P)/FAD-dependent oxidoreductase [Marinobacter sp.]
MSEQVYDVIIVGAGPAGSTLAHALAGRGRRILLMDKQPFPRDKTCAGWVTPAVWAALGIRPEDYGQRHTLQPITGFRIGMMGQKAVENDHGEVPVSYGIRRCEFDNYLLERVSADKALNTPVKTILRTDDGWLINETFKAPLLIGAGGHFCPVARHLGKGPGSHELAVAAKEVEFEMTEAQLRSCAAQGDVPELWFCQDLKGYAWVFRKGRFLNIGLGREDNHRLSEHLAEFVEDMKIHGRIPHDIPSRFKGHAYLLYDHAGRPMVQDGALLIGDAAGLAYTQSGEGIRPAIESALIAAEVIQQAPDVTAPSLKPYEEAVIQRFGQRTGPEAQKLQLPSWIKQSLASGLMRSQWFTRKVVTERWFLHQDVPPLKLTG